MSGLSKISNITQGFIAAIADRAGAALSALLVFPEQAIVVSEDTYAQHCGPARTALIRDPVQIACRGHVFDATLLAQLPQDSLTHHWNRMIMSAISLLDTTPTVATPYCNPIQLLPPLTPNAGSHMMFVPYYPPPKADVTPVINI